MAMFKIVDLPIKNCDFPLEIVDLPIENCDFPSEMADLPIKNCDYPFEIVLVGGWPTHLKNISQLGWFFPIYENIKNVPNQQPVLIYPLKLVIFH